MNYLQKLFVLTVLAQGVYVNEVCADEGIQAKIHKVVEERASSFNGNSGSNDLTSLIGGILVDIQTVLSSTPESEHVELKKAVSSLTKDPEAIKNMLNVLTALPTILKHLAPETKAILRKHAPKNFQNFIR